MEERQFVFTNENPCLIEELRPDQFLKIIKFVSLNELNFAAAPTLGFKVSSDYVSHGFQSFLGLIPHNPFKTEVVDTELIYAVRENSPIRIEIVNETPERIFNIAMLYTVDKLRGYSS